MSTAHQINRLESIVTIDNLELWTECFGNPHHPSIMLIMGSGGQGILWPDIVCETLANKGYFVVRYDHRDTGLSTSFDFETHPYTMLDMAQDVIHIMNHYQLQNAHIVGASMGGAIAMLLGAHFPERVRSLTLMVTSPDMRPTFDAFLGKRNKHHLPGPARRVLKAARKASNLKINTMEEYVQQFIHNAKVNSGSISADETLCRELALQVFKRMKNPDGIFNHFKAIMASFDIHLAAPSRITAPTHIVHGDEDPIFPLEHGIALQAAITGSTLCVLEGLGHNFANYHFFEPILQNILLSIQTADSKRLENVS